MIVSPLLEKLIWKGLAEWKNHVHGISGIGTIEISPKNVIIITEFTYVPFNDEATDDIDEMRERAITQLTFTTITDNHDGKQWQYIMKDNFDVTRLLAPEREAITLGAPQHREVYQIHDGNVAIDLLKVPQTSLWGGQIVGSIPIEGREPSVQLGGYGTALTALQAVPFAGAAQTYVPAGRRSPEFPSDPAVTPDMRTQFRIDASFVTTLRPIVAAPEGNHMFPIVNVGYVEINKQAYADLVK